MIKSPAAIFLIVFTFLITLGLAISLQGVFGINIGSVLNLGGNKITNVGAPTAAGDVAVKSYVDSVAGGHVSGGLYGHCKDASGSFLPSCFAVSPAFCNLPPTSSYDCACPPGYTMQPVGFDSSGWFYSSCYKN